jgi:hypothetical protein
MNEILSLIWCIICIFGCSIGHEYNIDWLFNICFIVLIIELLSDKITISDKKFFNK